MQTIHDLLVDTRLYNGEDANVFESRQNGYRIMFKIENLTPQTSALYFLENANYSDVLLEEWVKVSVQQKEEKTGWVEIRPLLKKYILNHHRPLRLMKDGVDMFPGSQRVEVWARLNKMFEFKVPREIENPWALAIRR